jgi:YidC/Oxa1 family membrane protein insertase
VIAVGVPLMILAGVATHFNSRASVARQSIEAAANPQTAMMNKLALYVFPLGVVVGGPFLPLAVILYWVANNIWTYGQQHYVFGRIEKEEELKKEEDLARRASNAPAPGSKPKVKRKRPQTAAADNAAKAAAEHELTDSTAEEIDSVEDGEAGANVRPAAGSTSSSNGKPVPPKAGSAANRAPKRTNNRPKKRRP